MKIEKNIFKVFQLIHFIGFFFISSPLELFRDAYFKLF